MKITMQYKHIMHRKLCYQVPDQLQMHFVFPWSQLTDQTTQTPQHAYLILKYPPSIDRLVKSCRFPQSVIKIKHDLIIYINWTISN